jgi:hypothetical protein
MNDEGDQSRPTGEHQKGAGGTPPPNKSAKYEQTRVYAYVYLASQFLIAIVAGAGIVVAVCSLQSLNQSVVAANKQADAAATQAQTAQQEFELSERPWVYEKVAIAKPLTYDTAGDAIIDLNFLLTNIGHSPAAATSVNLTAFAEHTPDFITAQKQVCDPIRNRPPSAHAIGVSMFPGEQIVLGEVVSVPRKQIDAEVAYWTDRFKLEKGKKPLIPFVPVVVGCIDYRFEFAPGHHQTPFIFEILRSKAKLPDLDFVLEPFKTVPVADLKLRQWFEAGRDAD